MLAESVLRAIVQCRFVVTKESQFTKHLEGENEQESFSKPLPHVSPHLKWSSTHSTDLAEIPENNVKQ